MSKKKKLTGRGGPGRGQGRKPGRNCIPVHFSIHKEDVALITELVKSKKKELDDARKEKTVTQNQTPPVAAVAEKATKAVLKTQEKIIKEPPRHTNNDFLERRRNAKLGIK